MQLDVKSSEESGGEIGRYAISYRYSISDNILNNYHKRRIGFYNYRLGFQTFIPVCF